MGKNCVCIRARKCYYSTLGTPIFCVQKLPKTPIFHAKTILYSSYILGKTWLTAWLHNMDTMTAHFVACLPDRDSHVHVVMLWVTECLCAPYIEATSSAQQKHPQTQL